MTELERGHTIATIFLDPVELAEYFLERIKDHDGARSIYVRHTKVRALEEAEAARVRVKRISAGRNDAGIRLPQKVETLLPPESLPLQLAGYWSRPG